MRPHNLSCYAGSMAFFSTPSDIVRFGLAANNGKVREPGTVDHDGELFGGRVVSLVTSPQRDIVVAVASNVTHADTSALALKVAEAFAK